MSKTIYAINGKNITLVSPVTSPVVESVPPAVYNIQFDRDGIHLIHLLDKFDLPTTFFGDIENQHDILITDYLKAAVGKKSTGALLAGVKGNGKTLLMEKVSNTLISMDIPVINIEENIPAFILRKVIRSVGPCCVLFDEFEKNYCPSIPDSERKSTYQADLLTLFSDSSLKGVMFIMASNDVSAINPMFLTRPGRLKRMITFTSPGFEHFTQVAKSKGVFDQIDKYTLTYIKDYLQCYEGMDFGIDVILELVEIASESACLYEFLRGTMYSNIPRVAPINRGLGSVFLKDGDRLTPLRFEKSGDRVEISEGVDIDFFTISEIPGNMKREWRGESFEVESEGGKLLLVFLIPPSLQPHELFQRPTVSGYAWEPLEDQKEFFNKWNRISAFCSGPSKDLEESEESGGAGRAATWAGSNSSTRNFPGYKPFENSTEALTLSERFRATHLNHRFAPNGNSGRNY